MSVLVERSMGELNKEAIPVYPLFQKGAVQQSQPKRRSPQNDTKTPNDQSLPANISKEGPGRREKKLKAPKSTDSTRAPALGVPSTESTRELAYGELLEVDPNNGRRKRRKTTLTGEGTITKDAQIPLQQPSRKKELEEETVLADPNSAAGVLEQHPAILNNVDSGRIIPGEIAGTKAGENDSPETCHASAESHHGKAANSIAAPTNPDDAKPRKFLHLNPKTGTIGSPPAKTSNTQASTNGKKPATGRKKSKSKLVTIRYGQGQLLPSAIGPKIDQILNNTKPFVVVKEMDPPKAAEEKSSKSTHPFFLGKAATKPQESHQKEQKMDILIVGLTEPKERTLQPSVRPQSCGKQSPSTKAPIPFSGFGTSTKIQKFPGAAEPAWPWKDMVHVRGLAPTFERSQQWSYSASNQLFGSKKSKYQAVGVSREEDLLQRLTKDLRIEKVAKSIRDVDPNDFPPLPHCLRIPVKHLEQGFDLQKRIRKELHTRLPPPDTVMQSSSEDEIQQNENSRRYGHSAILKAYGSISTTLSAFDKGQCETQAWIHKYAPKVASDVLQTQREISVLKDWLQTLTVKSVEAGLGDRSRASSLSRRPNSEPNGKRKRKSKKLDGFVVSSDEEDDDMDEISDPEDEESPCGGQGQLRRTIVRAGDLAKKANDSGRLTNAVVISGPHGCGKTAAVYAVAKELGFEVFEINPGSRRSGKDILEKVGDMTRNHLVQRLSGPPQVDGAADEDRRRIDEALANDLKSGRQGTMNSFFKAKPAAEPKAKLAATASKAPKKVEVKDEVKPRAPAKAQKQSLILFEEADLLYKDDTQFWPTILNLITTSKRPIIITCNDESAIPIADLPLHAVIRMGSPAVDVAADYMLLVAACEGHIIRRDAVKALYESRNMDLRAALTELNFWCQFGVGDNKNGLSWYLSRWPKGSEVDKDGKTLRVVSEGTYKTGMGWLSQDILESDMHHLEIEEETLQETCDGWHLDVGDWEKSLDMTAWAHNLRSSASDKAHSRAVLCAYDEFSESISAADLCSGGIFASKNQLTIDASIPELTAKAREDYILASELLEAPVFVQYDTLGKDISLWMSSRSRNYLQVNQHIKMDLEVPPELSRPDETDIIRLVREQATAIDPYLTRRDFSEAFDPISEPEKTSIYNTAQLEASMFDRTLSIITEDMAPYVRSIVDYDARLQKERAKLSNLMSEGGRKGKRMRTTRSAMSALEGGARTTTRREKYFGTLLNPYLVMKTGMQSWMDAALAETSVKGSRRSSKGSLEESRT